MLVTTAAQAGFSELIANCVVYSTAPPLPTVSVAAGQPVDLATVSPLITHPVRRFGDWYLDLTT